MKASGWKILCTVLAAALVIAIGSQFISKAWLDTTFRSEKTVTMTMGEKNFDLPLMERTAVMYKTSDSSYVLISKGRLTDIGNFYKGLKYGVESVGGGLVIATDQGVSISVERLADDLEYTQYALRGLEDR